MRSDCWQLNTRPRKSLGYKCPAELFTPEAFDFKQHHAAIFALQPCKSRVWPDKIENYVSKL
jgi:hypothetical protein